MNAAEVRVALRNYYAAPEWQIGFEVRDAAGFAGRRSADAVAMNTWPSRGLELVGIEIKVSRGDWLRELKTPAKAEAVARYCDRWMIAAPKGLIVRDELPLGWGLLEVNDESRIREAVAGQRTLATPIDRDFVAMMLRSRTRTADELDVELAATRKKLEAEFRDRVKAESDRIVRERTSRADAIVALHEKIAGLVKDRWGHAGPSDEEIVAAIEFIRKSGVVGYSGLASLATQMTEMAERLTDAAREFAASQQHCPAP